MQEENKRQISEFEERDALVNRFLVAIRSFNLIRINRANKSINGSPVNGTISDFTG